MTRHARPRAETGDRPGGRARGAAILAFLLLLPASPVAGEDEPGPLPASTTAARAHLAAIESEGEAQAIERAHAQDVDPWILAEELLLLGRTDVAERLAAAGLSGDGEALAGYVRRAPPPNADLAARVARSIALVGTGKPEAALEALGEAPAGSLTVTAIRALTARAAVLQSLDRDAPTREALEQAATQATVIGWRRAATLAQTKLLARTDVDREPAAARRLLTSLLALDSDTRDLGRSAAWCAQLGQLELDRGATRTARRWLLEAEGLFDVLAQGPGLTPRLARARFEALRHLSAAQMELGSTAAGMAAAFRAHDAAQHMDAQARVDAARQLANVYGVLGRVDEAQRHAQEAVDLAADFPPRLRARLQGDLARVLVDRGLVEQALEQYAAVRKALADDPDPRVRFVARQHIAAAWLEAPPALRDAEVLQRALQDLLRMQRELEDLPADFFARTELLTNAKLLAARAFDLLRRPREALPLLRELAEDAQVRDSPGLLRYAQRELGFALRATGRLAEATQVSAEAIDALRHEVATLSGGYAISRLSGPLVRELVEEHLACALALGEPGKLVEALERTRGIAFLAELRRRQREGAGQRQETGTSPALALAKQVAGAAQTYWQVLPRRNRRETASAREALWDLRRRLRTAQDRDEFEAARSALPAATTEAGPRFRPPPALRPDEAMLYYAETDAHYCAVLVRGDRTETFTLGSRAPFVEQVAALREAWVGLYGPSEAGALDGLAAAVVPPDLRRALLGTATDAEKAAGEPPAHIYVSAGGDLAHVPWPAVLPAALGLSQAAPTVSLIASQEVLSRVRTWNRQAGNGPLLALGDPDYSAASGRGTLAIFGRPLTRLEKAGEEAAALVDEKRGDLLLRRAEASVPVLRRCLFEAPYPFDVLHLACHGILYGSAPWMSALALHPTRDDDGLLTVDEVSGWRMPQGPRLVVLAACESGLGAPVAGEGEEGLVRAFLLAGARHVVASFWKVPDEASKDVMVAFHRHRRAGMSPAAALRRAQDEVRAAHSGSKPLSPRSWAGWAVWGPRD